MDFDGQLIRMPSAQLYARGAAATAPAAGRAWERAAPVPLPGGATYAAVAIDPSSHYRGLYLFVDAATEPVPLIRGQIWRGQFRRLAVAPFAPASWETASIDSVTFASVWPFNNQSLALRVWERAPAGDRLLLPESQPFVQEVLRTTNVATLPAAFLYHFHAPGARLITLFASNHNTANPAATVDINLSAGRPEVPGGDPLVTSHYLSTHGVTLATVAVPSAAAEATATATVVDPGFTEYYLWNGATTTPGVYTLQVGCLVTYYEC